MQKLNKTKGIFQSRSNDCILKSLKELKKTLKHKSLNDGDEKGQKKLKSNSLLHIHLDNPLSDSNKTKATFTESPPHALPLEAEVALKLFEDKLSELEKVELQDYKDRDKKFKVYFLGEIPTRHRPPKEKDFDDERGDYIADKSSNIYF